MYFVMVFQNFSQFSYLELTSIKSGTKLQITADLSIALLLYMCVHSYHESDNLFCTFSSNFVFRNFILYCLLFIFLIYISP